VGDASFVVAGASYQVGTFRVVGAPREAKAGAAVGAFDDMAVLVDMTDVAVYTMMV
jgi:hypothetical protein